MKRLHALLPLLAAISFLPALSASDPASNTVEFPNFTKAGKITDLVFAISTAKEIEIISLDPVRHLDENKKVIPASPAFHGFAILGTARITDSKDILRLAESLGTAIDAGKSRALCFSPRHALRIARPDGPLDIVVCFECSAVEIHGFTGLGFSALAPEPAQKIWESIFTAHLPKKS